MLFAEISPPLEFGTNDELLNDIVGISVIFGRSVEVV
jgi:hypothetical protein